MEPKGLVFDIKRYAIHDGPGIRTTVFLKGCMLKCPWCQNPEGIASGREIVWRAERCLGCHACREICPHDAISFTSSGLNVERSLCDLCGRCATACYPHALQLIGQEITVAEVMQVAEKDIVFYDQSGGGVTFSGGEPLMQPDFMMACLKACRERRIHTALDTSGYVTPETLMQIADHVDLFLWDLKIMDEAKHRQMTGVPNGQILDNLRMVSRSGRKIIVRFSLIPGINDDDTNLLELGRFAARLEDTERLDILPYHRAYLDKFRRLGRAAEPFEAQPPSTEALCRVSERLAGFGLKTHIGG
jgi:pyruvate formate lyase activating enzyme